MEFDFEKAQELFDKGHFSAISQSVGSDTKHLKRFPPELRILIAKVFLYTGKLTAACDLLDSLNRSGAPASVVAAAHIVGGLIRKREGRIEEASAEFRHAWRCAKDAGDRTQCAWAHAHLFRLLADGHAETELTSLLADARRSSAQAGDPHITAYLHDSVAAMETRRGRTVEAERHLRVARNLLSLQPNAWLEQLVALNASCIAVLDCDPDAFIRHSADARGLAQLTGHVNSDLTIENNDAYVALLCGRFDRASALLQRILHSPGSGHIELAALESLARMHLALGDSKRSEATLDRLEALRAQHLSSSYHFRTAAALRVKLLIRREEFVAAAALAQAELEQFAAIDDAPSRVSLMVLNALALSLSEQSTESAKALLDASLLGAFGFRQQYAQYGHACGRVLAETGHRESELLIGRSFRVWHQQGNQCDPLEAITARGSSAENEAAAQQLLRHSTIVERPSLLTPESRVMAVNHLAAALDLAYSPKLLGEELIRVVIGCALSPRAAITATKTPSSNVIEDPHCRSFVLGDESGKRHTLVCEVPNDPLKAILLGDVLRIGRAALALERAREEERNRAALWPADPVEEQGDAIFLAEEMQALLATVRRIAPTTVPVLITGETGTGKEVLARTIHACSARAKQIFLPFNCASTPKDMLDSQLFGHRRGAFTGAVEHFQGVVRTAAGGTLFLDEIGDAALDVQPKLLRFLDAGEVHALGDAQPARVDVRVIVATNADLDRLVTEGRFRDDLFYRLSIVRLHIPPLRERRVEIPSLANHYLRKHAKEYGKGDLRLSEETMEYLVLYKWPGNVRQLASEMRRLAALAESDAVLMPEHLSREIAASRRTIPASERVLDATEVVVRLDQPLAAATQHLEQAMLQYALKKCGGRVEETAAMLGISRKGLYLKRQRFGIDPPAEAPKALAG
jgi:DNA-binding NtrC family response regulator